MRRYFMRGERRLEKFSAQLIAFEPLADGRLARRIRGTFRGAGDGVARGRQPERVRR